jgi:hypothetical protein
MMNKKLIALFVAIATVSAVSAHYGTCYNCTSTEEVGADLSADPTNGGLGYYTGVKVDDTNANRETRREQRRTNREEKRAERQEKRKTNK